MLQFISERTLVHVQTNVKYNTHLQYECGIILINFKYCFVLCYVEGANIYLKLMT